MRQGIMFICIHGIFPISNESMEQFTMPLKDGALDFIINVLKEHEKTLDRLINELGEVIGQFDKSGELHTEIGEIEKQITSVQTEIDHLIRSVLSTGRPSELRLGFPVLVECKQWEDFKALAFGSEAVSFLFKQEQEAFQADALKEGRVLTYNGEFPQDQKLLKLWLSKELDVVENKIAEGVITAASHQIEIKHYCRFCGIENSGDALFCKNCGNKIA